MFDDNDKGCWTEEGPDGLGSHEPLFDVQVGGRFIEHVHVGLETAGHCDGEALQFTARETGHIAFQDVLEVEVFDELFPGASFVFGA